LRVLETIGKSLGSTDLATNPRIDKSLWVNVESSLLDCSNTLGKMNEILQELRDKKYWGLDIVKRARRQLKLKSKMSELLAFKQQVRSHYSGMQLALQTVNV